MRLSSTTRDRNSAVRVPGWHEPKIPQNSSPAASRALGSGEGTEDPRLTQAPREGCSGLPYGSPCWGAAWITAGADPEVGDLTAATPPLWRCRTGKRKGRGRGVLSYSGVQGVSDRDLATLPQILLLKPLYPHTRHQALVGS